MSWVMVPEEWKETKISNLPGADNRPVTKLGPFGSALKKSDYTTEGYKVYGQQQVLAGDEHFGNYWVSEAKYRQLVACAVQPGDILISTMGSFGSALRLSDECASGIINPRLLRLSVDPSIAIPEFLETFLRSPLAARQFLSFAQGGTMPAVNGASVGGLRLLLPPLPEQRKIAEILSTWDRAIEVAEGLLVAARTQKRALMQTLLTGKCRFPECEGQEWSIVRADEIFGTVSIRRMPNEPLLAVTQDQGVIRRDELERRVVMPDGSTEGYKLVVPGNFIISLRSFQGGLEYSAVRGLVSPAYHVLQPTRVICNAFYRHYFKSYDFIGHLAVAIIGIRDGKQISYGDFSFLRIPCPSLQEQERIGAVLDAAEEGVRDLEGQIKKLRTEKKALMQQLLTGKRRVQV